MLFISALDACYPLKILLQILDFWPQSAQGLSRKLRAALGFLYGRSGLPTPRARPIFMVTGVEDGDGVVIFRHLLFSFPPPGRSIAIKKTAKDDPGFEAEVDRVHALVIKELQALYDRHKAEYGWKDRPLSIE